jgi:hypothetical protein
MNRPRIAVIVSAVAASTAAFFVTSRYHLAGTLAGAALFPVIIILVSHGSTQGVDAVHKWVRRRREGEPEGTTHPASPRPAAIPPEGPARPRGCASGQWWLAGLAGVAVAVSVYALVAQGDPTVVRQTVIQKVPGSSEATPSTPSTTATSAAGAGGTTATTGSRGATSTTTDITVNTGTTTPPSATTTTSASSGASSTTDTTLGGSTTLP